jgi:hypothetical protein
MGIPEAQLETWSGVGAGEGSSTTYTSIAASIEDPAAVYEDRRFDVFLQGSYGNDTNIYGESDVDVIARYKGAFRHNIPTLPLNQQQAFEAAFPANATYHLSTFKTQVEGALRRTFGASVVPGKKAFKISPAGNRRSADVVAAFNYRLYSRFGSLSDFSYYEGICLTTISGDEIVNFPKQHSENCTAKHQATGNRFKPVVRIFKNIRKKLVADNVIAREIAPSYFIEGLIYNVPNDKFTGTYSNMVFNALAWLQIAANRNGLKCANGIHPLFGDGTPVSWPGADAQQFINRTITLWNEW